MALVWPWIKLSLSFAQDEGPRDTVDRKVSDLEFSEAELIGEEGVWASGERWEGCFKPGFGALCQPAPISTRRASPSRRHVSLLCRHRE